MSTFATIPNLAPSDYYRWTVEDYHRLAEAGILSEDDRVELLYGQILRMSPVGKFHAACVDKIADWLREHFGSAYQIRVQSPVVLDDLSEPEPDLAVLIKKEDFYAAGHPRPADIRLLVEVADTTLDRDREIKAPAYAAAGIAEYWIVNLMDRQLEQHLQPRGEGYQQVHRFKLNQTFEHSWLGTVRVQALIP